MTRRRSRHRDEHPVEYEAWAQMKSRCNNPKNKRYHRYGGRGISVCPAWEDFLGFYRDMGDRPESKDSIDRIDNNGNYEPRNCRWATNCEQQGNTVRSFRVQYKSEVYSLREFWRVHCIGLISFQGLQDRARADLGGLDREVNYAEGEPLLRPLHANRGVKK